ncbi:hypothetical protein [Haliangium sp.]
MARIDAHPVRSDEVTSPWGREQGRGRVGQAHGAARRTARKNPV